MARSRTKKSAKWFPRLSFKRILILVSLVILVVSALGIAQVIQNPDYESFLTSEARRRRTPTPRPRRTPTPLPRVTPTPRPRSGNFSSLRASLGYSSAYFYFRYSGLASNYWIDIQDSPFETYPDTSYFGSGSSNPVVTTNPTNRSPIYLCGRYIYWRIRAYGGTTSSLQTARVNC